MLTLGNRTVDRIQINLDDITKKYLSDLNFTILKTANREITNKRTPRLTSIVRDNPVSSMTKEYVTVYKRN